MQASKKKFFGKLNGLDFWLLIVVFTCISGLTLAKAGYAGVNRQIKGQAKVAIDVYISGLKTQDTQLFKIGEKSAFTIRNQPVYPPMTILAVKEWQKQVSFLSVDGKKALAFNDPSQPLAHDFVVSLGDEAEVTDDGYVLRGNKIKVGNQVELEGFKYRVQGVVVDIRPQN